MSKKTKNTKKVKNTNNKKNTKIIIFLIILLAIFLGLYFFLNAEDDNNKLTLFEKQWIDNNKNTLFNIEIPNNLSIYGEAGKGVLFNYVDFIEEETNLTFNKISYNYPTKSEDSAGLKIAILSNYDTLKKDDIIIGYDNYVLVSRNTQNIDDFNEVSNGKIGVLANDKEIFTNIYSSDFLTYSSIDNLLKDTSSKKIDYAIVPRYFALSNIISNNLNINYDFTNISNKIVLRMSTNEKLNSIVSKCLINWQEASYRTDYDKYLMDFYVSNMNVSDADKMSLSNKTYRYGFIKESSYNILINKEITSVAGEYINTISNMADIDFSYVSYDSKQELINAIHKKEVDIAFIDFAFDSSDGYKSLGNIDSSMVAMSKDYISLTNKDGLMNQKLYLYNDNNLYNYINDNFNASITKTNSFNNIKGILLIDEVDYFYHKNNGLKNYNLLFKDSYSSGNYFYVNNSEKVLFDLINFVTVYGDGDYIKNIGIKTVVESTSSEQNFNNLYIIILSVVLIPVILVIIIMSASKTMTRFKNNKKEDVLRYNDMLTSLKNRNYLNANIDSWDETKVYPRTVIILDLNNLKYVNDNYGHEEGNSLIKKAAAVLINTQLEKSEIIRTDGNEFLVYLIGYNEKQVNTYIGKLNKEFDKLPHSFGVAIGYSMIEDEIKTVDDAINEASIAMRKDKQERFK